MLSMAQIRKIGFRNIGENLQISPYARFYNPEKIDLGHNTRIDDFCVLSAGDGEIVIGNYVHIAVYSAIFGSGGVTMEDFSGLSSRVTIYSVNEDYSGETMTNPTVPICYRNVQKSPVRIGRHAIIGSGAVILPGVTIETGAAIGTMSLIKSNCNEFGIYFGTPARKIGERSRALLKKEITMMASIKSSKI